MVRGRLILAEDLQPDSIAEPVTETLEITSAMPFALKRILGETEKRVITQALEHFRWNRTAAARALGISRRQLFDKIQLYRIEESN